ncbi:MAG: SsrA-binding protein [Gaiellales bacterium]|jgi:SsrA-binding protein|nr:SsrA-binding protein [Gaiellales bacterium]
MAPGEQTVVSNRRARHEFEILERIEAGLVLMGTEVKSLRDGKVVLRDAYATERDGELWLVNATIEPYAQGNRENHEPNRERKLLVRKIELERLASRVAEKGLTLVPLRIYFKDGRAKVELALARGKEGRDKRDALAERDTRREIEREMKTRFRG